MGDGEGEGKVGEGKRMIALANSCEFLRGEGENTRGRRDSAGRQWFPARGVTKHFSAVVKTHKRRSKKFIIPKS